MNLQQLVLTVKEKCSRTWWSRLLTTIAIIIIVILTALFLIFYWKVSLPLAAIVILIGTVHEMIWKNEREDQ